MHLVVTLTEKAKAYIHNPTLYSVYIKRSTQHSHELICQSKHPLELQQTLFNFFSEEVSEAITSAIILLRVKNEGSGREVIHLESDPNVKDFQTLRLFVS